MVGLDVSKTDGFHVVQTQLNCSTRAGPMLALVTPTSIMPMELVTGKVKFLLLQTTLLSK